MLIAGHVWISTTLIALGAMGQGSLETGTEICIDAANVMGLDIVGVQHENTG